MKTIRFIMGLLVVAAAASSGQTELSGTLRLAPALTHSKTNAETGAYIVETAGTVLSAAIASGTNGTPTVPQMNSLVMDAETLTNGQVRTFNLKAATNNFGDVVSLWSAGFVTVKAGTNAALSVLGTGLPILNADDNWVLVETNGCLFAYAPQGYVVPSPCYITVSNRTRELDSLYAHGGLAIDAGLPESMQTTQAVKYAIGGTNGLEMAEQTNIVFSAADTINVDQVGSATYGIWLFQIDPAGSITTKSPMTNQAFTSTNDAVASLPAADEWNLAIGHLVVSNPAYAVFTATVSTLNTTNATIYNAATNSPTLASYRIQVGGVASRSTQWKLIR